MESLREVNDPPFFTLQALHLGDPIGQIFAEVSIFKPKIQASCEVTWRYDIMVISNLAEIFFFWISGYPTSVQIWSHLFNNNKVYGHLFIVVYTLAALIPPALFTRRPHQRRP